MHAVTTLDCPIKKQGLKLIKVLKYQIYFVLFDNKSTVNINYCIKICEMTTTANPDPISSIQNNLHTTVS
jgi:hypothetical protein